MKRFIQITVIVLTALLISGGVLLSAVQEPNQADPTTAAEETWIVKWNEDPPEQFWEETVLIHKYSDFNIILVQPATHVDKTHWHTKWSADPAIAYIHENQRLNMFAMPNDPLVSEQMHLDLI